MIWELKVMSENQERNIYNISQIDELITELTKRSGGRSDIRQWLKGNLRNYLLRDYDQVGIMAVLPEDAPAWAQRDYAKGRPIHQVSLEFMLFSQMCHVLDLFLAKPWLGLTRLAVQDALFHAKNWDQELKRQTAVAEDLRGIIPVVLYDNGWSWVKVCSREALRREGGMMRHCVAGYYGRQNTGIFSLRDGENMPHITLEIRLSQGMIIQAKGKGNQRVTEDFPYRQYVFHFLFQGGYKLPDGGSYDLLGYMIGQDGSPVDMVWFYQNYQADRGVAFHCLTSLNIWQNCSARDMEILWYKAIETVRAHCNLRPEEPLQLYRQLPLSQTRLVEILLSPQNVEHPLYDRMVKVLLGRKGLQLLPTILREEQLVALVISPEFFWFCLVKGCKENELLGIDVKELDDLLVRNDAMYCQVEIEMMQPQWLTSKDSLLNFMRRQLKIWEHSLRKRLAGKGARVAQGLRQFLKQTLGLDEAGIISICRQVTGLLAILEPNPQELSAISFRSAGSGELLAEYWNYVLPIWRTSDMDKARMVAKFLVAVDWSRECFEAFLSQLEQSVAESILLRKNYKGSDQVEQDLWKLGFAPQRLWGLSQNWDDLLYEVPYLGEAVVASERCAGENIGGCNGNWDRWLLALWVLRQGKMVQEEVVASKDDEAEEVVLAMCIGDEFLAEDICRFTTRELHLMLHYMGNYNQRNRKLASLLPFLSQGAKGKILSVLRPHQVTEVLELSRYPATTNAFLPREAMAEFLVYVLRNMESGETCLQRDDQKFWGATCLGQAWGRLSRKQQLKAHALWQKAERVGVAGLVDGAGELDADRQKQLLLAMPYQMREDMVKALQVEGKERWTVSTLVADSLQYLQYLQVLAELVDDSKWLTNKDDTQKKQMIQAFMPPHVKRVCVKDIQPLLMGVVEEYFGKTFMA